MMKFIFITLMAYYSLMAQNSNVLVEYAVDYLEYYVNSKDTVGLPDYAKQQLESNESLKKKVLEGDNTIFVLEISEENSSFQFKEFMGIDDQFGFVTLYMASRLNPVFKLNNQLYLVKDFFKKERSYEALDVNINWNLVERYKEIQGYNCQLAEADILSSTNELYKVKAWFTPEIPIPEGPSYIKGLPGLILGLEKHGRYVYATKIEFPKNSLLKVPSQIKP